MKIVIFGLTISSSWGNGHATIWRGLCRALIKAGHSVCFYERDVAYYSAHRDLQTLPGGALILYTSWDEIKCRATADLRDAEVAMTTSYCPDAIPAGKLMRDSPSLNVFYDLDTPVTFARMEAGEEIGYIDSGGLGAFDLVLSYTGGEALTALQQRLGARRVAPLYGSVDPANHYPVSPVETYRAGLSYLGTYAEDRQEKLEQLFIQPACRRPEQRFVLGGAKYPQDFPWTANVFFVQHLPPPEHPAFFSSSRLTLNITRAAMASMGYCPSGRLFEAAACGTPILSDNWAGLDEFFEPGSEILLAQSTEDALAALDLGDSELQAIARAASDRVLAEHTAEHRVCELERVLEDALCSAPALT